MGSLLLRNGRARHLCYWGATRLSLRPEQVGPATGVGLAVDSGSAGEAKFTVRRAVATPARS